MVVRVGRGTELSNNAPSEEETRFMAGAPLGTVLRYIRRIAVPEGSGDLSDTELLHRFATRQDGSAFAGLVKRHGVLVWSVCRKNVLRNDQDAEDAFQAA